MLERRLALVSALIAIGCGHEEPAPVSPVKTEAPPVASSPVTSAPVVASTPQGTMEPPSVADVDPSRKALPSVRLGQSVTNGSLPPEVVQRIVRQNLDRFRTCYEQGAKTNPTLEGRVTVSFVIAGSGDVTKAWDGGSDLPSKATASCVVQAFSAIKFPESEDKKISTVVAPILFAPDGSSTPPITPPKQSK